VDSYPRQAAATGQFRHGQPRTFRVTGEAVYYLQSADGRDPALALHRWDRASGDVQVVLSDRASHTMSDAERSLRERLRENASGITSFDVQGGRVVATAGGAILLWDVDGGGRAAGVQGAYDARLSPDGDWVSWVAGGVLHCRRWSGGDEVRIVGGDGDVAWATVDFIAAEELGRTRGYWWLPDSSGLLVQRTDDSRVPVWYRADPAHPQTPPRSQRYPHAGASNAEVELWRFDLAGEGTRVALPDGEYLAAVGKDLSCVFDRAQTRLTVCDHDGEVIATLKQRPWLDLVAGLPRRDEQGRLLAWDDSSGRRLTVDGRPVTPEGVYVRGVAGMIGRRIYLTACEDPADSRVAVVDAGTFTWLSDAGAYTTATVEDDLLVTSLVDWGTYGARFTIRDADFRPLFSVENRAQTPRVDARPVRLPCARNAVQTVVLFPSEPPPGPLPILMNPYGGPHAQRVVASRGAYATPQWLADQGFCVVVADGRGTPGQSPAWEHAIAGNLRDPALDDQIAALEHVVAEHGERVDASRVGILGWSYGGYLSALAVLQRPDVFHAAVAGAPVTDWRLYDTAYTERYLGDPTDGPQPYDHSSLIPLAPRLRRPLLLIHGLDDDNVFAAHTLRLSTALLEAGRPHEVLPLSGVSHMTPQPAVAENLLMHQVEFFQRHLVA
jgi:dipeptidyl-peptidase-4